MTRCGINKYPARNKSLKKTRQFFTAVPSPRCLLRSIRDSPRESPWIGRSNPHLLRALMTTRELARVTYLRFPRRFRRSLYMLALYAPVKRVIATDLPPSPHPSDDKNRLSRASQFLHLPPFRIKGTHNVGDVTRCKTTKRRHEKSGGGRHELHGEGGRGETLTVLYHTRSRRNEIPARCAPALSLSLSLSLSLYILRASIKDADEDERGGLGRGRGREEGRGGREALKPVVV